MDSDDLMLAVRAMEPEADVDVGPRKTPERRSVWRRTLLLLGCLMTTPSADLLVDELPVDEADLRDDGEERGEHVLRRSTIMLCAAEVTANHYQLLCSITTKREEER